MTDTEITGDLFLIGGEAAAAVHISATTSPLEGTVARAAAGDEAAFAELYRKFAPMVNSIALSRVPQAEADDLVQEVFISVHKNLSSLRDANAVGPWIASIARNRAANFYRARRTGEELYDDIAGSARPNAQAFEVLDIIRSLPEAYRETLLMRLVEGMTGPEIAEATGLTHDSVRVNLHRGMKFLRSGLGLEGRK